MKFDYAIVDGLGRARQRNIEPKLNGRVFQADSIGPIIELLNISSGMKISELLQSCWFKEGSFSPLLSAISAKRSQWIGAGKNCGIISGLNLRNEDDLTSFKIDAHQAALGVGFRKSASLLIAAMGELIGNVIDHSEAVNTGIAIFLAHGGKFEFVVADLGIGVLQSLTKNPDYSDIQDESVALVKIVETGVSRFDRSAGHGNGFRPIFERMADMNGELRFRSGNYAFLLDGKFGDRVGRQVAQRPRMRGFFTAVTCHVT